MAFSPARYSRKCTIGFDQITRFKRGAKFLTRSRHELVGGICDRSGSGGTRRRTGPDRDLVGARTPAGYTIHSAIHEVREDANCVMHLHSRAGVAVSAQKGGLLPISQQASVVLGSLAYHDYEGIALNPDEKVRLQQDLGDKTALLLRNHGTLVAAATIADAWLVMYTFETACQIQIAAQSGGAELIEIDQAIMDLNYANVTEATAGQGGQIAWRAMVDKVKRRDPSYCE